MCRLLAFASHGPTTLKDLLGEDLPSFVELSRQHADGWGMSWYDEAGDLNVGKDLGPAHSSELFDKLSRTVDADALVLHLRWATPGLGIALDNTHPFTAGRLAFAHNGALKPVEELEALLPPERRAMPRGTTDSERYFHAVLDGIERAGGFEAPGSFQSAVGGLLRRIDELGLRYNALNFVLLAGERLYATCAYNRDEEVLREDLDYYTLRYRVSDGAVVVASTGWDGADGWESLRDRQALEVDRRTLRASVLDLG